MSEVQENNMSIPEQTPQVLALITNIESKTDGSFVVSCNGYPFHATPSGTPEIYSQVIELINGGAAVTEYVAPEIVRTDPLSAAIGEYNRLRAEADFVIAPMQDAVDLDEATPDDLAKLTAWKQYRIKLSRVSGQAGYPSAPVWPVAPD